MADLPTTKQWVITTTGGANELQLVDGPIPVLGDFDVLVRIKAVSLNPRDTLISKSLYPLPLSSRFVLGSDGAGEVVAVGPRVTEFKPGDGVVTSFTRDHIYGSMTSKTRETNLGGKLDGTFRQYGVFVEHGLVHKPNNLSFREASTLTCAALTAWNCLYGFKPVKSGDTVLVQGSGGVSLFILQFAVAAGATVIATTSSPEKEERMKKLGASHVINYIAVPEWGAAVKSLTPNSEGVDHIIEVGGPNTARQSLDAIKIDGVISMVGFVAGHPDADQPGLLETLLKVCTIRGVVVGSREQLLAMNRAIEANNIRPIIDSSKWTFDQMRESIEYLWDRKHVGKVVVDFD